MNDFNIKLTDKFRMASSLSRVITTIVALMFMCPLRGQNIKYSVKATIASKWDSNELKRDMVLLKTLDTLVSLRNRNYSHLKITGFGEKSDISSDDYVGRRLRVFTKVFKKYLAGWEVTTWRDYVALYSCRAACRNRGEDDSGCIKTYDSKIRFEFW